MGENVNEASVAKLGYSLGKVLGSGAFANVRESTYHNSDRKIEKLACKIVTKKAHAYTYWCRFFHREITTITQLEHKHIIKVHSILVSNENVMIFMPLAENGDLGSFLKKHFDGCCSEDHAKEWYFQIMKGMRYLQSKNVAHRDLKLQNILLTKHLKIKIADFGFATDTCIANDPKTFSKTFCGTMAYTAPEIITGQSYNPLKADIWSCGVVLYHMCTGKVPFPHVSLVVMVEMQSRKMFHFNPSLGLSRELKTLICNILEPNTKWRMTVDAVLKDKWFMKDKYFIARHGLAPRPLPAPSQTKYREKVHKFYRYVTPTPPPEPRFIKFVTHEAQIKQHVGNHPRRLKCATIINEENETEDIPPYPPKQMYAANLEKALLQKQKLEKQEKSKEMKVKRLEGHPLTEEQKLFRDDVLARLEKKRKLLKNLLLKGILKKTPDVPQPKDDKIQGAPELSQAKDDKIQGAPELSKAKDDKIQGAPENLPLKGILKKTPVVPQPKDDKIQGAQAKDDKIQGAPELSKAKDDKIQGAPENLPLKGILKKTPVVPQTKDDKIQGAQAKDDKIQGAQAKDDKIQGAPELSKAKDDKIQGAPENLPLKGILKKTPVVPQTKDDKIQGAQAKDDKIQGAPELSQAKDDKTQTTPDISQPKNDKIQTSPNVAGTKDDTKSNGPLSATENGDYYGSESDLRTYHTRRPFATLRAGGIDPCSKRQLKVGRCSRSRIS